MNEKKDTEKNHKKKNNRALYFILAINIVNMANNFLTKNDIVMLVCGFAMVAVIPIALYDSVKTMDSEDK